MPRAEQAGLEPSGWGCNHLRGYHFMKILSTKQLKELAEVWWQKALDKGNDVIHAKSVKSKEQANQELKILMDKYHYLKTLTTAKDYKETGLLIWVDKFAEAKKLKPFLAP